MTKRNGKEVNSVKRHLRVELTRDELLDSATNLAQRQVELAWLKSEQKRVAADFAAKIKGKELDVAVLTEKINNRSEYRTVDCAEHLDTPDPGKKTILRLDNGTKVEVTDMTAAEMQRDLEMEPAA